MKPVPKVMFGMDFSSSILIDGYHFVRSAQQDYAFLSTNYHNIIYINIICPHDVDVHVLFCC